MSQYQTGTVTTEQGTNKVSGESCAWLANVDVGDVFKVSGVDATYVVALVSTDLTLSLASNYAGISVSGEAYQITRDFTDNYDIPEIWIGDKDWPFHLTQGLRIIDTELAAVSLSQAGETIVDQEQVGVLDLTISDLNKVHLLQNTGEATINLPSVSSTYVGDGIEFRKKGIGIVNIIAADADTIMFTGNIQMIAPSGEATFDFLKLILESETHWGCNGYYGPWETV